VVISWKFFGLLFLHLGSLREGLSGFVSLAMRRSSKFHLALLDVEKGSNAEP
jgi:hypothetical protein